MPTGRVIQLVSRKMGGATVAPAAIGASTLYLDSTQDFDGRGGFAIINGNVLAYNTRDTTVDTLTLTAPLAVAVPNGSVIGLFPSSVEKWAMVMPDGGGAQDSIWALVPFSLRGMMGPDGLRAYEDQEPATFDQVNNRAIITDVHSKNPVISEDIIPDGIITETKIGPGAITTPLLAANAVNASKMQADSITGREITSDAIDGMTITGALVRTAATGARVEIRDTGILQYDATNALLTRIGPDGNKFTGSVEATDIIIRDALQMFGKNNKMGPGSVLTLSASSTAPSQAPGVSWEYEQARAMNNAATGNAYVTGAHMSADQLSYSGTSVFLGLGRIFKDANFYQFPETSPGNGISTQRPFAYCRMVNTAAGSSERAVTMGENNLALSIYGFAEIWVYVWDDSAMTNTGSVAPTLKHSFKYMDFNYNVDYAVCRTATGSHKNWFNVVTWDRGLNIIKVELFQWVTDSTATSFTSITRSLTPLNVGEKLRGAIRGTATTLGIDGVTGSTDVIVIMTDKRNLVWNLATNAFVSQTWPMTFTAQEIGFSSGDVVTNTFGHMYSANFAAGVDQKAYKYENNHKDVSETWWASFDWRGESATTYRTEDSARNSLAYRARARLRITVPALPTPVAGVGQPRDPAKDPYGWSYYLGRGSTDPLAAARYRQPVQPVLAPGVPYALSDITKADYPTWSGSNPNVTSTFPTSTPAQVKSDVGGKVLLDGNGDSSLRNVSISGPLTVTGTGHAVEPLFSERAQLYTRNLEGTVSVASGSPANVPFIGLVSVPENVGSITYNTSTHLFTVAAAGRYRVEAHITMSLPAAATAVVGKLWKNSEVVSYYSTSRHAAGLTTLKMSRTMTLAASDNVHVDVTHNCGVAADIYGEAAWDVTYLTIERII